MESPADRLRQSRIDAGHDSASAAARALGLKEAAYRHHENGTRVFGADAAKRYAKAFRVDADFLLWGLGGKTTIPVIGYIGAGSEVYPFDDYAMGEGIERIPSPPGCPAGAVAVQIRGMSQYPIYSDGDVIVYAERRPDVGSFIGRRCIVGLADDRIMLKTLAPGSAPNLFTLISHNAPPIADVVVEWCARILWVRPK